MTLKAIICAGITGLVLAADAGAAHAQNYRGDSSRYWDDTRVEQYSGYGRDAVGNLYGYAGNRACGSRCAYGARQFGQRLYDESRRFSTENGRRLQDFGRTRVRPWIEDFGRRQRPRH